MYLFILFAIITFSYSQMFYTNHVTTWSKCKREHPNNDIEIEIKSLSTFPSYIRKKDTVTIEFVGVIKKGTLKKGTMLSSVYRGDSIMFTFEHDICNIGANVTCPLNENTSFKGSVSTKVPKYAFTGRYEPKVVIKVDDKEVSCVKFFFDIHGK